MNACVHRRTILAGVAGLTGLVAGCNTAPGTPQLQSSATDAPTPNAGDVDNAASGAATPNSATPDTASGVSRSPAAELHPSAQPADGTGVALVRLADLPVGGGTVVSTVAGPVLLVRPRGTTVRGYRATCPHAGVTVNAPSGGTIRCPAHNATFSAADGSRKSGPAERGLTALTVRVTGGRVYLT